MTGFAGKCNELSKLIKSWNLIKVPSQSEFDLLSEKILNSLCKGQTEIKIKRIIESELCITFGLFKTEFNIDKLTKEIMDWWEN